MDVLGDLLRIKSFREQKAERALASAKHQLKIAEACVAEAKAILKEYRIQSARRESDLYAEICTRIVLIREIDSVQIDVQLMREREEALVQELEKAEGVREDALIKEREARELHAFAARMREKFSEIVKAVEDERRFELSMAEDREIEEAAEVRFQIAAHRDDDLHNEASTST